jgi:hypothetical protein
MRKLLSVSHVLPLKVWRQLPALKVLGGILALAAIVGVIALLVGNFFTPLPTLGVVVAGAIVLGAIKLILDTLDRRQLYHKRIGEVALGGAVTLAFPLAWLHLLIFDRLFIRHGRWSAAQKPQPAPIVTSGPQLPVSGNPPPPPPAGPGGATPPQPTAQPRQKTP